MRDLHKQAHVMLCMHGGAGTYLGKSRKAKDGELWIPMVSTKSALVLSSVASGVVSVARLTPVKVTSSESSESRCSMKTGIRDECSLLHHIQVGPGGDFWLDQIEMLVEA